MQQIHVPAAIRGASYGTARQFQQIARQRCRCCCWRHFSPIYVVLGMLYESYSQPLTILSTLPSAGVGALLALMATGTEFSLIAFLGILLLIGIVKKNAIMMVDFAIDAERKLGLEPRAAIARACSLRFRPIMMTTCAAIAGALPLAIAFGDGTELRRPLGIAMVGGLIVSQVLTLYTTPVVYLYVDRARMYCAAPAQPPQALGVGLMTRNPAGNDMSHCRPASAARLRRALLGACAVGPDYRRPPVDAGASVQGAGDWKPSEPADALERGAVVEIFKDPVLDAARAADRRYRTRTSRPQSLPTARPARWSTVRRAASGRRSAQRGHAQRGDVQACRPERHPDTVHRRA